MECCGNCFYHTIVDGEWTCDNDEAEDFGLETDYNHTCCDFEERK
ncbi:hypothetical protein C8E03_108127 [Lachnotalea glycerini]|uniref:Uncharacterized protein n=1 Tax=Lachnotalea glycerini TaxID=1763509 RepID=A0A318EQN2_9FIRM|nr:hypothetical protein [Lachnotalea glycerini]PXV88400.1 hypothetical protein C8E03_108127 [Lachnotalea glycerini]